MMRSLSTFCDFGSDCTLARPDEGRLGFEFQLPGTFRPSRKILSDAKFPPHSLHYDHRCHHQNVVNTQLYNWLHFYLIFYVQSR